MAESPQNESTIIGADTHFKGELTFENTAKINGKFDGQITGKGELHVSATALCKADVQAASVNVDGTIEGNLHAKETVRLNNKGTVKGDIVAGKMIMAEGASFFGHCAVGPEAVKRAEGAGTPQSSATASSASTGNGGPASGAAAGQGARK